MNSNQIFDTLMYSDHIASTSDDINESDESSNSLYEWFNKMTNDSDCDETIESTNKVVNYRRKFIMPVLRTASNIKKWKKLFRMIENRKDGYTEKFQKGDINSDQLQAIHRQLMLPSLFLDDFTWHVLETCNTMNKNKCVERTSAHKKQVTTALFPFFLFLPFNWLYNSYRDFVVMHSTGNEKILKDKISLVSKQINSINWWIKKDELMPINSFIAGGFVAYLTGYTNKYKDIDIYIDENSIAYDYFNTMKLGNKKVWLSANYYSYKQCNQAPFLNLKMSLRVLNLNKELEYVIWCKENKMKLPQIILYTLPKYFMSDVELKMDLITQCLYVLQNFDLPICKLAISCCEKYSNNPILISNMTDNVSCYLYESPSMKTDFHFMKSKFLKKLKDRKKKYQKRCLSSELPVEVLPLCVLAFETFIIKVATNQLLEIGFIPINSLLI